MSEGADVHFFTNPTPECGTPYAMNQKGCVLWFTGLSGSGKSTVAYTLEHALFQKGKIAQVLDGDNIRHGED